MAIQLGAGTSAVIGPLQKFVTVNRTSLFDKCEEPTRPRNAKNFRQKKRRPDPAGDALACRCEPLRRDGDADNRHRAEIHDSDREQERCKADTAIAAT